MLLKSRWVLVPLLLLAMTGGLLLRHQSTKTQAATDYVPLGWSGTINYSETGNKTAPPSEPYSQGSIVTTFSYTAQINVLDNNPMQVQATDQAKEVSDGNYTTTSPSYPSCTDSDQEHLELTYSSTDAGWIAFLDVLPDGSYQLAIHPENISLFNPLTGTDSGFRTISCGTITQQIQQNITSGYAPVPTPPILQGNIDPAHPNTISGSYTYTNNSYVPASYPYLSFPPPLPTTVTITWNFGQSCVNGKCCPAGTTLSGTSWVTQFPTSTSTGDLVEPFRDHVNSFLASLHQAGASVTITATYRPPQRAYLMHYAYEIAKKGLDPRNVPSRGDVPICWVHTNADGSINLAQSRQAAAQMVKAYGIVHEPSLTSNHTKGLAIDMNISWLGTLHITNANGKVVSISTLPRSGMNTQLWSVGATYQVFKLASDPPHWSYNGH
jgi:hypothetical protein